MTATEADVENRAAAPPWRGRWVADALDVALDPDPGSLLPVTDLVGLALRRNPRRAHLLVSTVLGKHLPADPRLVYGAGRLLGLLAADQLADGAASRQAELTAGAALLRSALQAADPAVDAERLVQLCDTSSTPAPAGTLVLGYAETATALGHCVAESLDADYLHSTRRQVPGCAPVAGFDEEHSHATRHLLLPADPALLAGTGPLVLVDDELSTGRTALNTILALHRRWPRPRYLIAALVDLRPAADRAWLREAAEQLGVPIDVVALASGQLRAPEDALVTGRLLADREPADQPGTGRTADVSPELTGWPAGLAEGGRHGFAATAHRELARAAGRLAGSLADRLRTRPAPDLPDGGRRILVLGCEELMYAPLRIAAALAGELAGWGSVRFSSTTRSPVLPVDDPGYAIRTRLCFSSTDDAAGGPAPRWAYNVAAADPADRFSDIVLVTDLDTTDAAAPDGLLGQLASATDHLQVVRLPAYQPAISLPAKGNAGRTVPEPLTGPAFGSYPAADVSWLLTDLSGVELEAPIEEREEAIQSGAAHYAESLPQEYQPSAEYRQLFTDSLAASADRLAHAVGVVTELVLAERGPGVVLASLARAGTPVGVLMRRWARFAHSLDLPHYSVSIVRGRGIDELALAYLARHHDPATVQFVDGWTGKGAITRELAAAVAELNRACWPAGGGFSAELAVLADPGSCVSTFGSREDYLIPSACLNSTVSGLVSRTVLRPDLIGPQRFHGAKFYAELAAADVSMRFVDTVTDRFAAVATAVERDWPVLRDSDRRPTWAGWDSVRLLSEQYRIGDENLVKPGVGETTRVLLRRVPERVLIRTGEADRLRHVLLLARQRGVPVEQVDGLTFSCVGLIAPRSRRAETGAEG